MASSIPMGDFDYRQSPPKSKTSEDPQKSIEDTEETTKSSDPFGLGDVASKDADLRFLQHPPPPVSLSLILARFSIICVNGRSTLWSVVSR